MENSRLCVDCKYISAFSSVSVLGQFCLHEKVSGGVKLSLVTGQELPRALVACDVARYEGTACGREGKLWERKEEEEERLSSRQIVPRNRKKEKERKKPYWSSLSEFFFPPMDN